MIRTLTVVDDQDRPVANVDVVLRRRDTEYRERTNSKGEVEIDFPHDWADSLTIGGRVIKRDIDLGGGWGGPKKDLGVEREHPNAGPDSQNSDQRIRGRLFFRDGTSAHGSLRVKVEFRSKGSWEEAPSQETKSGSGGEFDVPLLGRPKRFLVKGEVCPARRAHFHGEKHESDDGVLYAVVLPERFGRGGQGGGMIAGTVTDADGGVSVDCKVTAEVASDRLLSFLANDTVTVRTDKKGRFVLPFTGGVRIKRLYVDGSEPNHLTDGDGPNAQEVSPRDIAAGSFNLRMVRQKKFLGLF